LGHWWGAQWRNWQEVERAEEGKERVGGLEVRKEQDEEKERAGLKEGIYVFSSMRGNGPGGRYLSLPFC